MNRNEKNDKNSILLYSSNIIEKKNNTNFIRLKKLEYIKISQ